MKKLVIIDGKSVFYRGYYAMPGLSLKDGTPTGGVYGFTSLALEAVRRFEPDYVVVAWDKSKTNIRRRLAIYPKYKANRKAAPEDFYDQIPILRSLLKAFGWPFYECDDFEADDIMGSLARQAEKQGLQTFLISSDLDMLQIVNSHTKLYALKKGLRSIEEFDPASFEAKYGIKVEQFLDFKALKGDASDNIPGVPGIGEKTAIELLKKYDSLDNVFEHLSDETPGIASKLQAGKELAYTSRQLAEIWFDAPVKLDLEAADVHGLNYQELIRELKKLEFTSLIRRLPKSMGQTDTQQGSLFASLESVEISGIKPLDEVKFTAEKLSDTVFVSFDGQADSLWCSLDPQTASRISPSDLKQLANRQIVAYDIKSLYHFLDRHGVDVNLAGIYDIAQSAFLINPLGRDFSIPTLVQDEIDQSNDKQVLAALRQVYTSQLKEFERLPKLRTIAHDFDFPLISVLFKMERHGIKINLDLFGKMAQTIDDEYKKYEKEIFDLAGTEFNLNSPKQLSEVLYKTLGLSTDGIRTGQRGYTTGKKALDKLRSSHPIVKLVEKAREVAKLQNTYVEALPKLVDSQSRIHTTFNQNVTSTGRLSSVNPNLQNIPVRTEMGRRIREGFEAGDGNVFVSADYSQFELRLAAVLSGDQALIDDFNQGIDIHTKTASDVFRVPFDEVSKDQRRVAKVINFGVLYGMSPKGLSEATDMSVEEAKDFIQKYFELRSPIARYMEATLDQARTSGYVETFFGRRRPTPDITSSNFMIRESAKRAAVNMPIQGTEADLMKLAMIKMDKELTNLGDQVLQIHDSILVECPKGNADQVSSLLKQTMESIAPELKIKLDVDVTVGENWGGMA
jgi:DNA polymerase-1